MVKLFNYKGKDVLVRRLGDKFQVGIRGDNQIPIWFGKATYDTAKLAKNSGREFARIMVDKIIVSEKKGLNIEL